MTKENKRTIIVLREGVIGSLVTDTYTYGGLLACIGVGIWAESAALQWVAGLMFSLAVIGKAVKAGTTVYSVDEARKVLDALDKQDAA
jgi:hypothetical protein